MRFERSKPTLIPIDQLNCMNAEFNGARPTAIAWPG
jgi:hypothetical protein